MAATLRVRSGAVCPSGLTARETQQARRATHKLAEVLDAELLLIGRVTYESFADAWPSYTGEFADKMNGMAKVVVSATLTDPAWKTRRWCTATSSRQ